MKLSAPPKEGIDLPWEHKTFTIFVHLLCRALVDTTANVRGQEKKEIDKKH